jgi:DNA-binding transcriptional MerR regulator
MSSTFSPGQVAQRSGFTLDTLRYYERIGLLSPLERSASGHRMFGEDDLEWLEVLRCLRETGMPIAQMRRYAELARGGQATLAKRLSLLTEHDAQVMRRITALQAQREHLQSKIEWYHGQLPPAARQAGEGGDCRKSAWSAG